MTCIVFVINVKSKSQSPTKNCAQTKYNSALDRNKAKAHITKGPDMSYAIKIS